MKKLDVELTLDQKNTIIDTIIYKLSNGYKYEYNDNIMENISLNDGDITYEIYCSNFSPYNLHSVDLSNRVKNIKLCIDIDDKIDKIKKDIIYKFFITERNLKSIPKKLSNKEFFDITQLDSDLSIRRSKIIDDLIEKIKKSEI